MLGSLSKATQAVRSADNALCVVRSSSHVLLTADPTCVVAELNRIDGIHIKAKELQRKYSTFIARVSVHHMTLNAQHARRVLMHAASGQWSDHSYGYVTAALAQRGAASHNRREGMHAALIAMLERRAKVQCRTTRTYVAHTQNRHKTAMASASTAICLNVCAVLWLRIPILQHAVVSLLLQPRSWSQALVPAERHYSPKLVPQLINQVVIKAMVLGD